MAHLRLHLESYSNPTLAKSEFRSTNTTILSVRGKTGGALSVRSTFQWSGGVKALTVLAIRHKLFGALKQHKDMLVSGERGSLAAALDSAVAKSAVWLCEMFGADSAGTPFAKRLIRRTNPERKRPGPVVLGLSPMIVSPESIEILVAGEAVEDTDLLYKLVESLEGPQSVAAPYRRSAAARREQEQIPFEAFLRKSYLSELMKVLRNSDIFSRLKLSAEIRRATSYDSMREFVNKTDTLVSDIDLTLSPAAMLGTHDPLDFARTFGDSPPLTVATMPIHAGAVAVLQHFSAKKGVPLDVNFRWVTSSQLVHEIIGGTIGEEPDLLTLNIGGAAWFKSLRHLHNYEVLMMMPNFSHRIMTPKMKESERKRGLDHGTYHIMYQIPSSSSIVFEDLHLTGKVTKSRVKRQETLITDLTAVMAEGDPDARAIVPFPFHNILHAFAGCEAFDYSEGQSNERQTVLCVHRRLYENRRKAMLLDIALRDAWLELIENPAFVEKSVDRLMFNQGFRRMVDRISGVHRAPWGPAALRAA